MIRVWAAIALLAISWLPGLGYYHAADPIVWALLVVGATALLLGRAVRLPSPRGAWTAVALLVPAIVIWPWPYRAAAVLLAAGLALGALPVPRNWLKRVGEAAVLAGVVLLAQAAALYLYESLTARSHELPWPLPHLPGLAAQLLGHDSAACGSTLALFSMRQVHRLGATWELLLDGPTLCFVAGGLAALLAGALSAADRRPRDLLRAAGTLALVTLIWLPVRAGLLIGLYMHRVLVTDYDEPMNVMNQFWSAPLCLAMLAGPVLLAWRFVGRAAPAERRAVPAPARGAAETPSPWWRPVAAAVLVVAAGAAVTAAIVWEPAGQRKAGRTAVEEGHSQWERTDRAMDTSWYGHDSAYNYACMYDYFSRFYEMSRLEKPIDDALLKDLDVLIVKTPTTAYTEKEIDAIERWVRDGGGLVLVGEHTDVFHTGECLSAISRRFGFTFRYDCLFGIDSFFEDKFAPPLVPHPVIQHVPPLDFAVSCSIAPAASPGRAAIRGLGLKSGAADYHATNFYPQAEDRPDMRYGAFVQLWATRCEKGRVAAFTDSTQFSNFSMFEAGKPELMGGMIEWANHKGGLNPRPWLILIAFGLAAGGWALARGGPAAWAVLLAAAMLGHAGAAVATREVHRRAMPQPPSVRPYVSVALDRTVSDVALPKGGFISGRDDAFGIFERWILRLGYFQRRASGPAARDSLYVIINPDSLPPKGYADALAGYVRAGGHLLVLDSMKNAKSAAGSVLWPFGLTISSGTGLTGPMSGPPGWPIVSVQDCSAVTGGTAFAYVQGRPVGASVKFDKGTVTAVGFSSRFSDLQMGVTGDLVPDATMRDVYEWEYRLLRALVEDVPLKAIPPPVSPAPPAQPAIPSTAPPKKPAPKPALPAARPPITPPAME